MSHRSLIARREFLKYAARTVGAAGMSSVVAEAFVGALFRKALAADPAKFYYIHLSLPGGPPRWYFDQVLNPTNDPASFMAGGFGTAINGGAANAASAVFKSTKMTLGAQTVYLPPVWGMGRSGYKNADLLQHMQMFRGVDMQINNHVLSNRRQVAPVVGGYSITGMLADASTLPLSSVNGLVTTPGGGANSPAGDAYRAAKSGAAVPGLLNNGANPLQALLKPFRPMTASKFDDASWQRAIDSSLSELDGYAEDIGVRPTVMANTYDKAIDLIKNDKFKVADKWAGVFNKYKAAVDEALAIETIKKHFPEVIKADGSALFSPDNSGAGLTAADLRLMFNEDTTLPGLADAFALAEILTVEDITSNVVLPVGNIHAKLGARSFTVTHDQHFVGSVVSVLSTTTLYRAMINCLHDLTEALKAANKFDTSVIHIGSEFSRTPKSSGTGSDHGYYGSSASIISGMINKFGLLGNIHKNGQIGTDAYIGTWGRAAPLSICPSRPIWAQDVANTICAMLQIPPVSQNGVILLDAGKQWQPKVKEVRNVA